MTKVKSTRPVITINCCHRVKPNITQIQTANALLDSPGIDLSMNEYLLLKFAHVIAFAYWLGGDLGTFLASRQVINRDLSPQSRAVALKIMLACDMGPKLAMPLMLPLGLHMAYSTGALPLSATDVLIGWLLAAYWFSVVMVLFLNEGKAFTAKLSQADLYFRIAVAALLLIYAGSNLASSTGAPWANWKILIFATMVCCGIGIRIHLKPFVPAFGVMMSQGATDESNQIMADSIGRCRPFVWTIWAGLALSAALGVHLIG